MIKSAERELSTCSMLGTSTEVRLPCIYAATQYMPDVWHTMERVGTIQWVLLSSRSACRAALNKQNKAIQSNDCENHMSCRKFRIVREPGDCIGLHPCYTASVSDQAALTGRNPVRSLTAVYSASNPCRHSPTARLNSATKAPPPLLHQWFDLGRLPRNSLAGASTCLCLFVNMASLFSMLMRWISGLSAGNKVAGGSSSLSLPSAEGMKRSLPKCTTHRLNSAQAIFSQKSGTVILLSPKNAGRGAAHFPPTGGSAPAQIADL